jgi:3-hydroxyacyl-[acyl-carrier-protein] dehydratase
MPVKNDALFKISKLEHNDGIISARLDINKDCEIFKGHFPGHPVVPGACMLQIVKEVLEEALEVSLRLKKADHLKFISMIDPGNTLSVALDIAYKIVEEGDIGVIAKLMSGEVVCFKFQGKFIEVRKS